MVRDFIKCLTLTKKLVRGYLFIPYPIKLGMILLRGDYLRLY